MWQSATAAAVALAQQQHLLFGGLGGIIAVIVGGVISVIAMRNVKRSEAQPAPSPQPAPASRRHNPPAIYGEPAPPTIPSRRLHPGPISLSEPPSPQQRDDDEFATNLFDPDIFSDGQTAPEEPTETSDALTSTALPLLRPASHLTAEWRAQAAPPPSHSHAPIWNRQTPFSRPAATTDSPSAFESLASVVPPIWRLGSLIERNVGILAPTETSALSFADPAPTYAPVWASWLRPAAPDAERTPINDAAEEPSETAADAAPPIWSSFLRQE
jgi:hypothetical protein